MKIEVFGCSGSVIKGYNTTSFLVDGDTLIDAGSAASGLSYEELSGIDNILLTHAHIDHIKELPFILDTVFSPSRSNPVTVWGSAETIDALNDYMFNGMVWPDLKELNDKMLRFERVPDGVFSLGDIRVRALEVDHIPGSLAFLLVKDGVRVLFSGDTGYNQALFDTASAEPLDAFFVETSFPDRMDEMARVSGHLTPSMLKRGLGSGLEAKVIAYHIKPQYLQEVIAELPAGVEHIEGGEVMFF